MTEDFNLDQFIKAAQLDLSHCYKLRNLLDAFAANDQELMLAKEKIAESAYAICANLAELEGRLADVQVEANCLRETPHIPKDLIANLQQRIYEAQKGICNLKATLQMNEEMMFRVVDELINNRKKSKKIRNCIEKSGQLLRFINDILESDRWQMTVNTVIALTNLRAQFNQLHERLEQNEKEE